MFTNKQLWSSSSFSDSQTYQVRPKSRPGSKRYRKSILLQAQNRPHSSNSNAPMTYDALLGTEDQSDISKITMDQTMDMKDKSETMKLYHDNENAAIEDIPFQAFRSTLANLSDALATLDEGEYLRWDTHLSPQRTPMPSKKMIERAQTLTKQQFSVNNSLQELSIECKSNQAEVSPPKQNGEKTNRTSNFRESMDMKSTFRGEADKTMISIAENSRSKPPQQAKKRVKNINISLTGTSLDNSGLLLGDLNRRKDKTPFDSSCSNKKRYASLCNDGLSEKENRCSRKARAENKEAANKPPFRHMYQEDHYKVSKLNIGGEEYQGLARKEADDTKIRDMFAKTLLIKNKWGNSLQWTAGKTLAGFQIQKKKKGSGNLISKSLNKSDVYVRPEKMPLNVRVNTFERSEQGGGSGKKPITPNDLSVSFGDRDQMANRISVEEIANQDTEESMLALWDGRKTIYNGIGTHVLQKLTPSLKIKKDIIARKKIDTPSSKEGYLIKCPERAKSVIRDSRRSSYEKERINSKQRKAGDRLIEESLLKLEEKYAGSADRKSNERYHNLEEMITKGKRITEQEKRLRGSSANQINSRLSIMSCEARRKLMMERSEDKYLT